MTESGFRSIVLFTILWVACSIATAQDVTGEARSRPPGQASLGTFVGESWQLFTTATVSLPHNAQGGTGATVQVPISVSPGDGILGIDATITYDPAVLTAQNVTTSGIGTTAGFTTFANVNTPGTILISSFASSNAMSGSGEFAKIQFHVIGAFGATSALGIPSISINEGQIPAGVDPGTFTVTCTGAPNGTACSDGNPCTVGDTCQAGVCAAGSPRVCTAIDVCHVAGVCDPQSGACSNPPAANGTACNDGNGCTINDSCQAGACTGGTTIVVPAEITGLALAPDRSSISWNAVAGGVYDVVRGFVSQLPAGSGAGETCVATSTPSPTTADAATPPSSTCFWYLTRAKNSCGTGTYGYAENQGVQGAERNPASCP